MAVKLQSETGSLVLVADGGEKIVLKISFGKFSDQINGNVQSKCHTCRVENCGFVALVTGIGRVALPLVQKFLVPAPKLRGRSYLFRRHSKY